MTGRRIVIGDIHGCYRELLDLCDALAVTSDDVIVSVGDLVDRGPDSVDVVRFFQNRANSLAVVGNHERKHIRGVFSYSQEIARVQFGHGYADAVRWMASLPYWLELEDAIVVHAAVEPGVPLAEQKPEVLCGSVAGEQRLESALGAGQWWWKSYDGARPVIFGHHVVEDPLVVPGKVYGLDTGACHGGRLTALVLPDFQLCSVPARADHWSVVRRAWQADVLAARSWREMTWTDLDEQLARFGGVEEPRARACVEALHGWREALAERMTEAFDAVHAEARRIAALDDPRAGARAHPLAGFVFQCLGGRFDRQAFARQCRTPAKLEEVGAALGLGAVEAPRAPVREE